MVPRMFALHLHLYVLHSPVCCSDCTDVGTLCTISMLYYYTHIYIDRLLKVIKDTNHISLALTFLLIVA